MKKFHILLLFAALLAGCQKKTLQLNNPNNPTPASLTSEAGILDFGLGIYEKSNTSDGNIWVIMMTMHSIVGDEIWSPWGNWGWRWAEQCYTITLPNGTVVPNPIGPTQKVQLQSTNTRQAGELNVFEYEWELSYYEIGQCNLMLQALDNPALQMSGDTATKKGALRAWAYWWKGYFYSRVGSMYLAGVISDATDGTTNDNFVSNTDILTEANKNFSSCLSILGTLSNTPDYQTVMEAVIPDFCSNTNIIDPQMWARHIYSMEARNYLVNHKVKAMTSTDWSAVLSLAQQGLQTGDYPFEYGQRQDGTNDLSGGFYHPYDLIGDNAGFTFVSERLIQDFRPGDARLTTNFAMFDPADVQVNVRNRGLQFGTRYYAVTIENGGSFATTNNLGAVPVSCTAEENELMLAEAKIYSGDINGGLTYIDQVRATEGAGLPAVAGTGLSLDSAIAQLHSERRVGLFLRGVAFYDMRRWSVNEPVADGGGRKNAIVVVPGTYLGTTSFQALPCTMDYQYLDYWDVPAEELDFNTPASTSVPVVN